LTLPFTALTIEVEWRAARLKAGIAHDDREIMRRFNIQVIMPSLGRYEVIKENINPTGVQDEDYWNECFTWGDLKTVVPRMRRFGWKTKVTAIEEEELPGKIHLFPFTYGVNHEVQMIKMSHLKLILTRDMGLLKFPRTSYYPFGY
jgi:hypothetical protein